MSTTPIMRKTMYVLVPVTLSVLLASCGDANAKRSNGNANANTNPPVTVDVATVTTDAIAQPVTVTGTFGSRDEIPLSFKIGGVIARVVVDQGVSVHKGQLLAALDLREIDAMVDKAKVGVDKAERDAARIRRLQADSVATLAQLQDATSAYDAAGRLWSVGEDGEDCGSREAEQRQLGETGEVKLTKEWKEYTVELAGKDLTRIKTGFVWTLPGQGSPVVFFLDDIRFE